MKNKRFQIETLSKLTVLGLLLFSGIYILACSSEKTWKDYQQTYVKRVSELTGKNIEKQSLGISVLEVPELGVQDRCTTCHIPMDDLSMFGEKNPLKPHPSNYLRQHPPEHFGCTICHGGKGEALSREKAQSGSFMKGDLVQTSCGKCHGEVSLIGAQKLTRGKSLLKKYQCINCHFTPNLPETDDFKPAPSLKGIASKVSEKWLRAWLKNPKGYLPNAIMPRYEIDEKYVDALVGYLMGFKDPRINSEFTYPEGDVYRGVGTFRLSFCSACHSFNGKGGNEAPDLGKIGNKINEKWLIQMLANPHGFQPKTTMPQYNFSLGQISDLAAHLLEWSKVHGKYINFEIMKKEETLKLPRFWKSPEERSEIGRRVYKELRCANCHGLLEEDGWWRKQLGPEITLMGDKSINDIYFGDSNVSKTLPDYVFEKIRNPQIYATPTHPLKMPKYELSNEEISDIVLALLSFNSNTVTTKRYRYATVESDPYEPEGEFGRLVDKFRCFSCHSFKGRGYNITYDLTVLGSRVNREWLFNYLKEPYTLRPMLTIRMPIFNMTDEEAGILTRGFMREMVDPEIKKDFEGKLTGEMAKQGKILFENKGCLACHQMGEAGGYVGPSFTEGAFVGEKLKAGWIFKWLKNSRAMMPEVLEPNYDLADQEAWALTAYLMSIKTPD